MQERMSLKEYRKNHLPNKSKGTKGAGKAKAPKGDLAEKKSRGKYRAQKVRVNNTLFDSKLESQRYLFLKNLESSGVIKNLELQKKYPIEINGELVCMYVSDFVYTITDSGREVVEDAKGFRTPEYKLKKKLVKATLGIEIKEVVVPSQELD